MPMSKGMTKGIKISGIEIIEKSKSNILNEREQKINKHTRVGEIVNEEKQRLPISQVGVISILDLDSAPVVPSSIKSIQFQRAKKYASFVEPGLTGKKNSGLAIQTILHGSSISNNLIHLKGSEPITPKAGTDRNEGKWENEPPSQKSSRNKIPFFNM
jgi:hypothetical protein